MVDDVLGQRDQVVEDHLANPRAIPLDVLEKKQASTASASKIVACDELKGGSTTALALATQVVAGHLQAHSVG